MKFSLKFSLFHSWLFACTTLWMPPPLYSAFEGGRSEQVKTLLAFWRGQTTQHVVLFEFSQKQTTRFLLDLLKIFKAGWRGWIIMIFKNPWDSFLYITDEWARTSLSNFVIYHYKLTCHVHTHSMVSWGMMFNFLHKIQETNGQIFLKSAGDIHGPQRINPNNYAGKAFL